MKFRYSGEGNIESIASKPILDMVESIWYTDIGDIIYLVNLIYSQKINDILNNTKIDELKVIVRKNKIKKTITKKYDIKEEFLDFWLNNHENLFYLEGKKMWD